MRSASIELAQRINEARVLIKQYPTTAQVATVLMERYEVSGRQAYRYIQQAQKATDTIPIPEPKEVFTVKLPRSLVYRLRGFAKSSGKSLSFLVTQALEIFLKTQGHG